MPWVGHNMDVRGGYLACSCGWRGGSMLDSYVTWRTGHLAKVHATFRHESVAGDTVDQQVYGTGSSQAHCGCGWKSAPINNSFPEFSKVLDHEREMHVRTAGDIDARSEFPWFGEVAPRYVSMPKPKSSLPWIIAILAALVVVCFCLCILGNMSSQPTGA